jgi:uncharacterized protein (DUF849 family)
MKKCILTAAITGGIHTPGMSEYLPITPENIVLHAIEAHRAGASIVHIHARTPDNGQPTSDIDIYNYIVKTVKKECDVIICVTTGGSIGMSLDDRLRPVTVLKPELASCNAGSINFVLSRGADKLVPKFDWEIPYLKSTYDLIFSNTYQGIEYYVNTMNSTNTLPEFEVYDVGMINTIAFFKEIGVIKQKVYIQFVLGVLGGIPATPENLMYMVNTANKLLGEDFNWSVAAAGKNQFKIATLAIILGGNARVGLEDNLYLRPKIKAKNSAEQIMQIKTIAENLGVEIANTQEAREILELKGNQFVNF